MLLYLWVSQAFDFRVYVRVIHSSILQNVMLTDHGVIKTEIEKTPSIRGKPECGIASKYFFCSDNARVQ